VIDEYFRLNKDQKAVEEQKSLKTAFLFETKENFVFLWFRFILDFKLFNTLKYFFQNLSKILLKSLLIN
jgi:hypothetical protein